MYAISLAFYVHLFDMGGGGTCLFNVAFQIVTFLQFYELYGLCELSWTDGFLSGKET